MQAWIGSLVVKSQRQDRDRATHARAPLATAWSMLQRTHRSAQTALRASKRVAQPSRLPSRTAPPVHTRCTLPATRASFLSMQPAAEPQAAAPEAAPDAKARFAAAMPKTEIGATDLLAKHPEYDGRGCIVAIFDTGVDPGAAGLATTPDGRPKIVDLVDGTGSGDVDMSAEVKADEAGVLKGLYGKELRASQSWRNPSGCWRVGAKALFELYPGGCKKRIQEKRKARSQLPREPGRVCGLCVLSLPEWTATRPFAAGTLAREAARSARGGGRRARRV